MTGVHPVAAPENITHPSERAKHPPTPGWGSRLALEKPAPCGFLKQSLTHSTHMYLFHKPGGRGGQPGSSPFLMATTDPCLSFPNCNMGDNSGIYSQIVCEE